MKKKQKNKKEEAPKMEIRKYDANILAKVKRDGDKFSLNDLWNIAGAPDAKRPNDWKATQQGSEFIKSVCKILNADENGIIKSKRGKGGGTYGVKSVALEYAQYLDADLAVLVNEVFFQRLKSDRLEKISKSVHPSKRERTLQSEKPTISLFKICDDFVEKELHNYFAMKHIRGEWYHLSNEDIEYIISKYNFK